MTSLFRPKSSGVNHSAPIITSVRLQTSSLGRPIPLGFGKSRVAGNLIWYGDLTPIPHVTQQASGGKGGGGGGSTDTTYTYTAALLLALGWGEIGGVARVWKDKEKTTLAALGLSLYTGTASQTAFPHLVTNHPGEALAYRRMAYVASAAFDLADSASLPNHNFEVAWPFQRGSTGQSPQSFSVNTATDQLAVSAHGYVQGQIVRVSSSDTLPGGLSAGTDYYVIAPSDDLFSISLEPNGEPVDITSAGSGTHSVVRWVADADPADVAVELITRAGVDPSRIGDLSEFSAYCVANGIFISPVYTEARATADQLREIAAIGNAEIVCSEDKIRLLPYADAAASGNGVTFTPDVTPVYEFNDDHFLTEENEPPVEIDDDEPSEAYNIVKLKFFNRERDYNEDVVEAQDDDHIGIHGRRVMKEPLDFTQSGIVDPAVARFVVQAILQHQLYFRCGYIFRLPPGKADLLEPMDLIALTDARLGLSSFPVRITSIEENDGESQEGFTFHVREFPEGVASPVLYPAQLGAGYSVNFNAAPGNTGTPVIFDAPGTLTVSGYELWIAASGPSANWGGCQVWIATDPGGPFKQVGSIYGRARHGVLSGALPSGSDPDTANTCAVDLSISRGELTGGTQSDADNENTLSWINGELISFQDATLTASYRYDLETYLRRGVRGTQVLSHGAGAPFVRCDQALFRHEYDASLVGSTIYVKLPAFNVFGGGQQSLGEVSATAYLINGPIGAPATVTGFQAVVETDLIRLLWNAVAGAEQYEIRYGTSWDAGIFVQLVKATSVRLPLVAAGTHTWWIKAIGRSPTQYSLAAASAVLVVTAALSAPLSSAFDGGDLKLTWSVPIGGSYPIARYEVRVGDGAGEHVAYVDVTTFRTLANWSGSRHWIVKAIDLADNESILGEIDVVVNPPSTPAVRAEVIDNNVILRWDDATQTLPLQYYEIRKGLSLETSTLLGTAKATAFFQFEASSGTYIYFVLGVDSANNSGSAGSVSAIVSQPPDYVLFDNFDSLFDGEKVNAVVDNARAYLMELDGATQYAKRDSFAPFESSLSGGFTREFWIKPTGDVGYAIICSKDSDSLIGSDYARIQIGYWYTQGMDFGLEAWHYIDGTSTWCGRQIDLIAYQGQLIHLIVRWDSTNGYNFFVNGQPASYTNSPGSTGSQTAAPRYDVGPFSLGKSGDAWSDFMLGAIGPTRVYTRAITDTEAAEHYHGIYKSNTNLVASWNMNEVPDRELPTIWDDTINSYDLQPISDPVFSRTILDGRYSIVDDEPSLLIPVPNDESYQEHFTNNSFASPQDQVDAGYPLFIQPGAVTGSYEEVYDYGTVIAASQINALMVSSAVAGSVSVVPTISVKENVGDAWIDTVGSWSIFATQFRYVKIRLDATATDDTGVLRVDRLTVRLDVKLKTDSGRATVGANEDYIACSASEGFWSYEAAHPTIPSAGLRIEVLAALSDWSPGSISWLMVCSEAAPNRSWMFRVATSGALELLVSSDGTNFTTITSTANLSALANGAKKWVAVDYWANSGGGRLTRFYTSDDGVNWTQLGSDVTGTTLTIYTANTAGMWGGYVDGLNIYKARLYGDPDSPSLLANIDIQDVRPPYFGYDPDYPTWLARDTGERWGIDGEAMIHYGGALVEFNADFIDVKSITATPLGTEPGYVIADFIDIPYPTSFKLLAYDLDGNRTARDVSWQARGV